MGIFKSIKRMLSLGSKKSRSKKREEEAAAKSRDLHVSSTLLGSITSRTSSFSEFREMYTDWACNSSKSSEEQFPYRSTSDSSLERYEQTSEYADYFSSIESNSTRELRQVAIPGDTENDDVTNSEKGFTTRTYFDMVSEQNSCFENL